MNRPVTFATTLCAAALLLTPLPAASAELRLEPGASAAEVLRLQRGGRTLERAVLRAGSPVLRAQFAVSPSEWAESVELRLAGDPAGAAVRTPVEVRLNGGEAVRLDLLARGFSAEVALPVGDLRSGLNVLEVRLAEELGACPEGAWDLDLLRSDVRVVSRPRRRAVFLGEVEMMLRQPVRGARRVAVDVRGADALALEALVAQGLMLRTPDVPTLVADGADLRVVAGTRGSLRGRVADGGLLEGSGPRVAVDEGRPLRLVITGDTEAEVRAAAEAWARHRLPDVRRRVTGPGEMALVAELAGGDRLSVGRTELGALGHLERAATGAEPLRFRVGDPEASRAELHLELEGSGALEVELNGRPLAVVGTSGTVAVPQGWLEGRNTLGFRPVGAGCDGGVRLGAGSRISLAAGEPSGAGDLSRVAATGGLYGDARGAGTHVLLPAGRRERWKAYPVLAEVAAAAGGGLTEASYGTGDRAGADLLALADLPEGVGRPRAVERVGGGAVASFPEGGRWVASFAGADGDAVLSAWGDLGGGVSRVGDTGAERVQMAWSGGGELREHSEVSRVVRTVRTETLGSLEVLRDGWSEVEWPVLRRTPWAAVVRPRGRYPAPGMRTDTRSSAFRDIDMNSVSAAGFRAWERNLDRKADRVRRATGVRKLDRGSLGWSGREGAASVLLLLLAFFGCSWGLVRGDTRSAR